jgi:hypothetical protein
MKDFTLKDSIPPWHEGTKTTIHYIEYTIDEVKVMVGCIPSQYSVEKNFFNSIDAWLNVSERFIRNPCPNNHWAPWDIASTPPLEVVYSSLRMLNYWITEKKFKRIYIHCIHGANRSPSIFGFFLLAYYPDRANEIVNTAKFVGRYEETTPDKNHAPPLEQALDLMSRNMPELKELLANITKQDPEWGHFEDWIHSIPKKQMARYNWERMVDVKIPTLLRHLWWDTQVFLKYTLFVIPWRKTVNWIHKKLNTKRGQSLKKFGL